MHSTRSVRGGVCSNQYSLTDRACVCTQSPTRLRPDFVAACAVEKGVEVIDDLYGESLEIKEAGNTWLTYGPPMQLARVRYTYYIPIARAGPH